jgi:predicted enzyme related to lactoylglutathione lyase
MPTRDNAHPGTPCWLDLGTSDKAASKRFYGELFGWTSEDHEEFGGYTNFSLDGALIAGGMQTDGQMGPDGWTVYLCTDDIAKACDAAVANDGKVEAPPMPVGELGQMAFLADAGGAFVGLWQPAEHRGFQRYGQDGAPGWFELWTRDWQASLDFYRNVVGSDIEVVEDTPELRYAVIREGETQWAGIMDASSFLPDGVPAHWSVYFHVADEDATIERAVSLGASVAVPAEDTPYGRLATLTDPTGAQIKLVQPPA